MLTGKSLSKEEIAYYRAPFSTAFCLKLKLTNARVRKYNIGILIGYKNPRSSMYRIFFPNKIPLLFVRKGQRRSNIESQIVMDRHDIIFDELMKIGLIVELKNYKQPTISSKKT